MQASSAATAIAVVALASVAAAAGSVTPAASALYLGTTVSNLPNIYRDGGGGGAINGLNWMWFSDGLYTSDGAVPEASLANLANFTSNSIACSGYQGAAITQLLDFGTTAKGPNQFIPYFYTAGESDSITAVWPNQNIATLCSGACGVGFPQVVNRTALAAGLSANLYNTAVQISLTAYGPVASRPVRSLFTAGQPAFGSFSSLLAADGYLYLFARVSQTTASNGLKAARVPQDSWASLTAYQFWNGAAWAASMPAYDDGGRSNVFNYSQTAVNGVGYGPGTGDLFYSQYYGVYLLLFQADDAAIDNNVYLTYSSSLTGAWSTPTSVYTIPTLTNGYSYSFHAYPNYDSTGKVVPLSWSEFQEPSTFLTGMANLTFS
ncbi:hypothetical protein HK405_013136 [Cladochytrium tenue]|nr:hypothetical protein HK405_013136 [Cladochytrium tenue]